MAPPIPTNKILPPTFVQGIVNAIGNLIGSGGPTHALLHLAIKDYLPLDQHGQPDFTYLEEYFPIWTYYRLSGQNQLPVDFVHLSLLSKALIEMYDPIGAKSLSRKIGNRWWLDTQSILSREDALHCLEYLIGMDILRNLAENKSVVKDEYRPDVLTSGILKIAFQSFASLFTERTGIKAIAELEDNKFLIRFIDCPFCKNEDNQCGFLFGVVEEMLRWLVYAKNAENGNTLQSGMTIPFGYEPYHMDYKFLHNDRHQIQFNLMSN
jgi:hypothetical protein